MLIDTDIDISIQPNLSVDHYAVIQTLLNKCKYEVNSFHILHPLTFNADFGNPTPKAPYSSLRHR